MLCKHLLAFLFLSISPVLCVCLYIYKRFHHLLFAHITSIGQKTHTQNIRKTKPNGNGEKKPKWQCAFKHIEIVKCVWVTISPQFAVHYPYVHTKSLFSSMFAQSMFNVFFRKEKHFKKLTSEISKWFGIASENWQANCLLIRSN